MSIRGLACLTQNRIYKLTRAALLRLARDVSIRRARSLCAITVLCCAIDRQLHSRQKMLPLNLTPIEMAHRGGAQHRPRLLLLRQLGLCRGEHAHQLGLSVLRVCHLLRLARCLLFHGFQFILQCLDRCCLSLERGGCGSKLRGCLVACHLHPHVQTVSDAQDWPQSHIATVLDDGIAACGTHRMGRPAGRRGHSARHGCTCRGASLRIVASPLPQTVLTNQCLLG